MGSSSPWDSRESGRRGRSPTPGRIPGVSSGVNEGTPPQIASDSMIAASIDIDDLVKASTFDELAPSQSHTIRLVQSNASNASKLKAD